MDERRQSQTEEQEVTHPELDAPSPSVWSVARVPVALLVVTFLLSLWAYGQLPETVTVRTLFTGRHVSTESAVQFAFQLPFIIATIIGLNLAGMRWNVVLWPRVPMKAGDAEAMRPLVAYNFSVVVATSALIHAFSLGTGLGWVTEPAGLRGAGVTLGLAFILVGNVLPLVTRPNAFIGFRASVLYGDRVRWSNAQRVAGYTYVVCGLVLAAGFAIDPMGFTRMVTPLLAVAIVAPLLLARTQVSAAASNG